MYFASEYIIQVLDMLGLQTGWTSETEYYINNPTWYVSILLLCYVVFYFITEISRKRRKEPWKAYMLMIAIGVFEWLLWNLTGFQIPFINAASARGFMCFFSGLVFARLLDTYLKNRKWFYYFLAVAVIGTTVVVVKVRVSFLLPVGLTLVTYPSIIFVLTGMEEKGVFKKSERVWTFLARISYSVYIWHVCFLMLFMGLNICLGLGVNWSKTGVMLLFVGVMESIAVPSYYFFEKRLNPKLERVLLKIFT